MQNERKELINKKRNKKGTDGKVRLVFTHNSANPPLHQWLRDSKKHLEKNDLPKDIGRRVQICSKQPPNLQRIVGGCKDGLGDGSSAVPDPGCFKCKKCRVLCPKLQETKYFKSTATQKQYTIRDHVTCTSDWVVYLGTCLKCRGQYVGKSKTPLKIRHSNHKQEIKKQMGGICFTGAVF